jgi:hypothetical protein
MKERPTSQRPDTSRLSRDNSAASLGKSKMTKIKSFIKNKAPLRRRPDLEQSVHSHTINGMLSDRI